MLKTVGGQWKAKTQRKKGSKKVSLQHFTSSAGKKLAPKGAFLVWLWYNIVVLDNLLITFLDTDKLNSFMYHTF